jgi:hypothetical protein
MGKGVSICQAKDDYGEIRNLVDDMRTRAAHHWATGRFSFVRTIASLKDFHASAGRNSSVVVFARIVHTNVAAANAPALCFV